MNGNTCLRMISYIKKNRYLISRRVLQVSLLILFGGTNWWNWKLLMGNYSSAYVFNSFYLTDPYAVIQTLAAGFAISMNAITGALTVLAFYALIAGRSFCSWVCPINIITDLAVTIRRKWGILKQDNHPRLNRKIRYWVLVLGVVLSAILGVAAFEVINPITILHRGIIFGFGVGWTFIIAVFLFDLMVSENGWCSYICPTGALYATVGRFSLIKVKHEVNACTSCMLCRDVCHEKQILKLIGQHSGFIGGECSICGRCIEVCEDNALKYSIYKIKSGG